MNAEPFLHAHLHEQLEPDYVIANCDADMIAYQEEIDGEHYLYKLDNNARKLLHDWILRFPFSIGSIHLLKSKLPYRKYSEPQKIELKSNDKVSGSPIEDGKLELICLGESYTMTDNWVYLLSKQGYITGILKDVRCTPEIIKNKTPLGYDPRTDTMIDVGEIPTERQAHYNMDYNHEAMEIVGVNLFDRYWDNIRPNLLFHIEMFKSIMSQLEYTNINLSKNMLLETPFLKKGVSFHIDIGKNRYQEVSLWRENIAMVEMADEGDGIEIPTSDRIYMFVTEGNEGKSIDQHYVYFFDVEELPDTLNEKTISRFFKKMKYNNKKRLEREEQYVMDKFDYLKGSERSSLIEKTFIQHIACARNYTYFDEDGKEHEREGQQKLLSTVIKLSCAYWVPKLRREIKRVGNKQNKRAIGKGVPPPSSRRFEWGTDNVYYISPPTSTGNKITTTFYTRPTMATVLVNDVEKYKDNDYFAKLPEPINGRTHTAFVSREGCWKGEGGELNFPTYFAGRPPSRSHSKGEIEWLKYVMKTEGIHIQHALNEGQLAVPNTPYRVDGYCEETNTIYEYHGDYWHGNPDVYPSDEINKTNKKTMGELYENTIQREQLLRSLGYNVVVMWESEWEKQKFQERNV